MVKLDGTLVLLGAGKMGGAMLEGWLKGGVKCNLTVIPLQGYGHNDFYLLPVRPSPSLACSALLCPSQRPEFG